MPSSKVTTGTPVYWPPLRDRFYQATRAYVAFYQQLFRTRPMGQVRWSPNNEETEILITGQAPVNLDTPHIRRALIVQRGQGQWITTSQSGVERRSLTEYNKKFLDSATATMIMTCIAKEPVEAQEIAWLVFICTRLFKTVLIKHGQLHGVSNQLAIGPVSPPGSLAQGSSTHEWSMVQVFSPFFVHSQIEMTAASGADYQLFLEEIDLQITEALGN